MRRLKKNFLMNFEVTKSCMPWSRHYSDTTEYNSSNLILHLDLVQKQRWKQNMLKVVFTKKEANVGTNIEN